MTLLAARAVRKQFGGVRALAGVDLSVERGEIVALAGENGSGKSTLARILAGAIRPDAGALSLDGRPVAFRSPREALDGGVALVSQELTAVPQLSLAENVLLTTLRRPAALVSRRELARRAEPVLARVGLDGFSPHRPFAALAPGRRELAEVAKALASEPRVLVIDEATTRLPDPEHLFALVEQLAAEGLAVVFITQRLREIRRLAHRAVVLRDGEVTGELPRSELSDERLSALMVGRPLASYFHKPRLTPGDVVLRVRGLVTDRAPVPVSLEVRRSEVVGLAGLVGSGRSELLETLAGFRRRRAGEIAVGEVRLPYRGTARAAVRAGLRLLPEDRHAQGLVLGAPVRENLAIPGWRALRPVSRGEERRRAREAVTRFGIRCRDVDADVRTLSGGNQQKVVIARCVSGSPRILLLDEPTRGVDVGAREEIYGIVGRLLEAGTGVLLASSDLPELLGLCDRIVVLREGAVAGELRRGEASEERIMLHAAGEGVGTRAA